METQDKVLARLLERQAQINKAVAAHRSKTAQAERAKDTRRKIMVGAFVMSRMDIKRLRVAEQQFVDTLTRAEDRALFGLPPLPSQDPAADAGQGPEGAARGEGERSEGQPRSTQPDTRLGPAAGAPWQ